MLFTKNLCYFCIAYKSNEYAFLNKDFLNKNYYNFLNNLNAYKTEKFVDSLFMNFASNLNSKNNPAFSNLTKDSKIHLFNYAREHEVEIRIVRNLYVHFLLDKVLNIKGYIMNFYAFIKI